MQALEEKKKPTPTFHSTQNFIQWKLRSRNKIEFFFLLRQNGNFIRSRSGDSLVSARSVRRSFSRRWIFLISIGVSPKLNIMTLCFNDRRCRQSTNSMSNLCEYFVFLPMASTCKRDFVRLSLSPSPNNAWTGWEWQRLKNEADRYVWAHGTIEDERKCG